MHKISVIAKLITKLGKGIGTLIIGTVILTGLMALTMSVFYLLGKVCFWFRINPADLEGNKLIDVFALGFASTIFVGIVGIILYGAYGAGRSFLRSIF